MKIQFRKLSTDDITSEFWMLEVLIPKKKKGKRVEKDEYKVLNSYRGTTKRDCFTRMVKSLGRHIDDYSGLIEEV